jgi:hypothetical protein
MRMKKRILIILLCIACVGAYAQKKPAKKTTRTKKPAAASARQVKPQNNTVTSQASLWIPPKSQ